MKIKSYWVVSVDDYHEFTRAKRLYNAAGLTKIKFEEVGCNGSYYAVFWTNKKPTKYIEKCKKEIAKYYDENDDYE